MSMAQSSLLFTNSTTTTLTKTTTPPVSVNISNMGAGASGFASGATFTTVSPLRQDDLDTFKVLQNNLDKLLESTKCTSSSDNSITANKALLETTMKKHAANLEKAKKVVDSSTVCKDTTKKVEKLIYDAQMFMGTFQTSFEVNMPKENQVISSLGTTLHIEKDALEKVCTEEDDDKKLKRISRDAEADENLRVAREAEEKERVARKAGETFKAQKTIFPLWTHERILNEAIDNPNSYWLDPVGSFKL
ncbi:unnamed protein product [Lactuca saligna]|uniref:Uncharacterized protein n=1 Tax=Lactuca saligna TaxID=75948 RepID=A0AA35YYB0_LACSI|nr:unnamed protein product [Lactuca saligna]